MTLLRSAVFNVWFYGVTTVMALCGPLVSKRDWRVVLAYARRWSSLSLAGLRAFTKVEWRVEGLEHLPAKGPMLIAPMHQSAFDTLIWVNIAPTCCYVLKRELTRVPMFGRLLIHSGMIPVDRAAGVTAMRGLLRATDRAIAQGRQIVIFPEGTRVPPGVRAPLLPGVAAIAARGNLPVFPVITNSGSIWGRNSFLKTPGTIIVRILPPIPAGLPRDVLMEAIAAAFYDGDALTSDPRLSAPARTERIADDPVDNSGDRAAPSPAAQSSGDC